MVPMCMVLQAIALLQRLITRSICPERCTLLLIPTYWWRLQAPMGHSLLIFLIIINTSVVTIVPSFLTASKVLQIRHTFITVVYVQRPCGQVVAAELTRQRLPGLLPEIIL